MDYKYIEQLMERYWTAETSETEERILQAFFEQSELPEHLASYKHLFDYIATAKEERVSCDFEARILQAFEDKMQTKKDKMTEVKALPFTWSQRLRPFFNAAAVVAIVALVGTAAGFSFRSNEDSAWDYNTASFTDSYDNPQAALDETMQAFKIISDGLKTAVNIEDTAIVGVGTDVPLK